MPAYNVRGVLLDIEGTTSSISFVYDKMFPYVREHLSSYLDVNWNEESLQNCLPLLAADLNKPSLADWIDPTTAVDEQKRLVATGVIELMDGDVKATGLKQLQGLIWKDGFHSGQLVAHLFDDVAPAIQRWNDSGLDVRIYSSGSIAAQKLFFGHSVAGDLLSKLSGHYDTTTGGKKESTSYQAIASEYGFPAGEVLFVSDVVEELVAARAAGMQTCLSLRAGNKDQGENDFEKITTFAEIEIKV